MGPVRDDAARIYLRPETAQGIFVNFKNVLQFARKKPPFGIAQIGKAFRNEITPGNFIFRTREFEQMEIEFFVPPAEAAEWHQRWMDERMRWYTDLGIRPDHLQLRAHGDDELSHYSSGTSDIEYLFPMGWSELEGIANRGDFDLTQHAKHSGEKLEYVDTANGDRYVPHVIEPSAGADRGTLAFMVDAYDEEKVEGRERTVLRLHPRLAPVKVAVLPLVNKEGMPEKAREIYEELRARIPAEFDVGGSIGKRYRRQDEIGTPWGVTVDHQTMEDDTVTLRDRDSLEQTRVPIDGLADDLAARLNAALEEPQARLRDTPWVVSTYLRRSPRNTAPSFARRFKRSWTRTSRRLERLGPPVPERSTASANCKSVRSPTEPRISPARNAPVDCPARSCWQSLRPVCMPSSTR